MAYNMESINPRQWQDLINAIGGISQPDSSKITYLDSTVKDTLDALVADNTTNKTNIQTNASDITTLTNRVANDEKNIDTLKHLTSGVFDLKLFNYKDNFYLNSDGTESASTNWCVSDFISLPNYIATLNFVNISGSAPAICFYDSSKTLISGASYLEKLTFNIDIPLNAFYCRLSISKNNKSSINSTITAKNVREIKADLYAFSDKSYNSLNLEALNKIKASLPTQKITNWSVNNFGGIAYKYNANYVQLLSFEYSGYGRLRLYTYITGTWRYKDCNLADAVEVTS